MVGESVGDAEVGDWVGESDGDPKGPVVGAAEGETLGAVDVAEAPLNLIDTFAAPCLKPAWIFDPLFHGR